MEAVLDRRLMLLFFIMLPFVRPTRWRLRIRRPARFVVYLMVVRRARVARKTLLITPEAN